MHAVLYESVIYRPPVETNLSFSESLISWKSQVINSFPANDLTQLTFTYSKSTIETLDKGVK